MTTDPPPRLTTVRMRTLLLCGAILYAAGWIAGLVTGLLVAWR